MARENIRTLRKLRKMSQAALAKTAGLTPSEVSRIECGYCDLDIRDARAIARALGVAVNEIADQPHASPTPATPVVPERKPAVVPFPIPASPPVTSNDLGDPANFRELPDLGLLDQGPREAGEFRTRLRHAIERATTILHTSKVPAAVWRAWREFERRAQDVLREPDCDGAPATAEPTLLTPREPGARAQWNGDDFLAVAERSFRRRLSSKTRHQQKSFNARFLEVARGILPQEVSSGLTATAEYWSKRDPAIGFMRHFRNAARELLSRSDLSRIVDLIETKQSE